MAQSKNIQRDCLRLFFWFVFSVAFVALAYGLCSCKPQRQIQAEYIHIDKTDSLQRLYSRIDSLLKTSIRKDSVNTKDSVFVYVKGDTVMIDRWHTVYKEHSSNDSQREKEIIRDTVYQTHTEYIDNFIEKEVVKEICKPNWWQTTLIWIGVVSIGLLILWMADKIHRDR